MKSYIPRNYKNLCLLFPMFFLWVLPMSGNYSLKSYEFGGGGGESQSATYGIDGSINEGSGVASSAGYGIQGGLVFQQNANVPTVVLANTSNWYNKLHVTVGPQNNASDAIYAIAISTDDFVTTSYVQSDNTVGPTLGNEDYQTYTAWGGASGEEIIGLLTNTTYKVKVKSMQGVYTESAYGPESSAATDNVTLSFDIDVSASDQETAAPYAVAFGSLNINAVTTATNKVWVDLATNAESGAYVYIYDEFNGLRSTDVNHTITSTSTDLSGATEGYGIRSDSTTNLTAVSPYNVSSDNVGVIDSTVREIFHSSASPVTAGRASMVVKVKTSSVTPSSNEYTDTLTLIASGSF